VTEEQVSGVGCQVSGGQMSAIEGRAEEHVPGFGFQVSGRQRQVDPQDGSE
jgi:hypothetical protein